MSHSFDTISLMATTTYGNHNGMFRMIFSIHDTNESPHSALLSGRNFHVCILHSAWTVTKIEIDCEFCAQAMLPVSLYSVGQLAHGNEYD